jgi:hypothetical protein
MPAEAKHAFPNPLFDLVHGPAPQACAHLSARFHYANHQDLVGRSVGALTSL